LAFGEEAFLAALAMVGSEAFFNKLLVALPDKSRASTLFRWWIKIRVNANL
jgi:hypothetical protein